MKNDNQKNNSNTLKSQNDLNSDLNSEKKDDSTILTEYEGNSSVLNKLLHIERSKITPTGLVSYVENFLTENLSERELNIIKIRFGLGKEKQTLEEVGKIFNITRERVRQIVKITLKKLSEKVKQNSSLYQIDIYIRDILERRGGIVCLNCLLEDFIEGDPDEFDKYFLNYLFFFLEYISSFSNPSGYKVDSWIMYDSVKDLQKEIEEMAVSVLSHQSKPVDIDTLYNMLSHLSGFEEWKEKVSSMVNFIDINLLDWKEIIKSYLSVSEKVSYNQFGMWGMIDSPLINPTRIADRAYLVLDYYKKPLHFKEIGELIQKFKFSKRKVHIPTVHNELIMDDRFVLVGRGIYALKEWGYKEGTVADVITDILRQASRPMTKEEIIDAVLKKRIVKRETIILALSNKDRFLRVDRGYYTLNQ